MSGVDRALEVEYVNIDDLSEYPDNAKVHTDNQIDEIAKSIEEFGFNDPIAIDERSLIIEGHGRYMAAKKIGLESVPVIRLCGLSEDQRRAYSIVHNKLTMDTGFDLDALQTELEKISEIDMSEFGFDDDDDIEPMASSSSKDDNDGDGNGLALTYSPSHNEWDPDELYEQTTTFDDMIDNLECSSGIREMLRIRAHWFCDFAWDRIADYYEFQASDDERRMFEKLRLVIVDDGKMNEAATEWSNG